MVDEAERAIHDALCVVRDVVVDPRVVAGGGAAETEVAKQLRTYSQKLNRKGAACSSSIRGGIGSNPVDSC